MGQQSVSAPMRQSAVNGSVPVLFNLQGCNVADLSIVLSGWTQGATVVDVTPIQPPLGQTWQLTNWAVTFYLYIANNAGGSNPRPYGRLGRIIAGVLRGSQPTAENTDGAGNRTGARVNPMLGLPGDSSLLATVWDGTNDPTPPPVVNSPNFGPGPVVLEPITGGLQLPTPLEVEPGEQVSFGLWITPSLVQNATLWLLNAIYTLNFDDGQPPRQTTWGGP